MNKIKFRLDGCDISFIAQAPKDITLEQLLRQCNRIIPDYCACGINNNDIDEDDKADLDIDYNDIKKLIESSLTVFSEPLSAILFKNFLNTSISISEITSFNYDFPICSILF